MGEATNNMARKQKTEKDLVVSSGAAAAATRRKTVTSTRTKHSTPQAEMPAPSSVELPTPEPVTIAASFEPSFEEISTLAYSYWLARNCQGGSPEEDWLRAEQELRVRVAAVSV